MPFLAESGRLDITVDDCRRIFPPLTEIPTPLAWPSIEHINWGNDREIPLEQFNNHGLSVLFSEPINQATLSLDTFIVTLELPLNFDNLLGHVSIIVHGEVALQGDSMCLFRPDPIDRRSLAEWIRFEQERFNSNRIRCRVMLKGNAILSETDERPLDGDVFGQLRNDTDPDTNQPTTDLIFPSGDGNKGGDFESWFYLVQGLKLTLSFDPPELTGQTGLRSQGTITLDPAPSNDAEVSLSIDKPALFPDLPSTVIVSGGQSSSRPFEVHSPGPAGGASSDSARITASFAGASDTVDLKVTVAT